MKLVRQYLPKSIADTYKIIQAPQTNLRTDKNYVIQRTSNHGPMPAAEVSIHRPLELLENIYKLQELNVLHEVQVDVDPLWEFKLKASSYTVTTANKALANKVMLNHSMILALLPEEAIVILKERIQTPEPPELPKLPTHKQKSRKRARNDTSDQEYPLSQTKKQKRLG